MYVKHMGNSLGDYNIKQSSSYDIKNIKWTQKKSINTEKSKNNKKTKKKTSSTNIIHSSKLKKPQLETKQISKVVVITNKNLKNKKKITEKPIQNSSASNCKIKQGFKRPGR